MAYRERVRISIEADEQQDDQADAPAAPEPSRLPCGHLNHENGGPADYNKECRR